MKIIPYNNRLYIEEVRESEQKVGSIMVPDFAKDRRDIPKFMKVKILAVASNLSEALIGEYAMIETGFLEEVKVEGKIYTFCPVNYVVCFLRSYENQ